MNIIYAENGAGKMTLARILHSLGTNNSISIIQRKYLYKFVLGNIGVKIANR